jgi:hypothetical protein
MDIARTLVAALIYPGLVTAVVAGALFGLLVNGASRRPALGAARSREGLAALASVVFAGLALAALPWPFHLAEPGAAWLWAWAGFELAFLLPLLPALTAGAPAVARAAIREAQLGVLGRAALWGALAASLAAHADWRAATAPAHLLALAAALLALPAAIGWGPFGAEERVTPDGAQAGLPDDTRALDAWARDVRAGALVAAALVAALPAGAGPPWIGAVTVGAGLVAVLLILRRLDGRLPRLTLPAALRFCALWAFPAAALASLALALAERL